jgi:hypothetical protein
MALRGARGTVTDMIMERIQLLRVGQDLLRHISSKLCVMGTPDKSNKARDQGGPAN